MRGYFIFITTATLLLLSGCGSGSDTETETQRLVKGIFYDSEVDGMDYICTPSNLYGITGDSGIAGGYTCEEGDNVTFSIGDYELGTCEAKEILTPSSLFPNSAGAALNVARLLQTIDRDKDPSNGIKISEDAIVLLANVPAKPTDSNFDEEIEAVLGKILIQAEIAKDHLDETIAALQEKIGCLPGQTCSDKEPAEKGEATDCLPGEDCGNENQAGEGETTNCRPGENCGNENQTGEDGTTNCRPGEDCGNENQAGEDGTTNCLPGQDC